MGEMVMVVEVGKRGGKLLSVAASRGNGFERCSRA